MQKYDIADENYYITVNTVLNVAQRASEIFECSETNEKRQLLNFLLQNLKLKEKTLQFELKKPFNYIVNLHELEIHGKEKTPAFDADVPSWLAYINDLRTLGEYSISKVCKLTQILSGVTV